MYMANKINPLAALAVLHAQLSTIVECYFARFTKFWQPSRSCQSFPAESLKFRHSPEF